MNGPIRELPARLIRLMLGEEAQKSRGRGAFNAMLRASDREEVRRSLNEGLDSVLIGPLRARLSGPDAELRAHAFVASVVGILTFVWTIEDKVFRAADTERIIQLYAEPLVAILLHEP